MLPAPCLERLSWTAAARLKFSTSFPLKVKQTRLKISTLQVEIFNLHLLSWGSHTFNIEIFGDMMVDSRADDFPQAMPLT